MIEVRKSQHIDICLKRKVEAGQTGLERLRFSHRIPRLDMEKIDTGTRFFGKHLKVPFLIDAITGGCKKAKQINSNLAEAAEDAGAALAVGSQRAVIENGDLKGTYTIIREKAPSTFVVSNIGAAQLAEHSPAKIKKIVDMLSADALAVHFNQLQEAIQPEGDVDFSGVLKNLKNLCSSLKVPVIAKETGAGFCKEDAALLEKAGVAAIDIAGYGGTSFALVEHYRSNALLGKTFKEWGIPTLTSLLECRSGTKLPLIASGGLRSGLDAAKCLALGASLCGFALPFLKPATTSASAVIGKIKKYESELRTAMFLTNSKNLAALRKARLYMEAA